ncbi:MAG: hypothetical protein EA402_13285 [Planctomycetota bacterium]|nr:MAG: hypothetical protein EA402_13285 [Planctomycetota bacterium]
MTTTPYGFWMNRRGRLVPILEHGRAIIAHPRRYGLTKAQVAAIVGSEGEAYNPQDRAPTSPRGRLYRLVMDAGWVRIRGGLSGWSIQFAGDSAQVARLLLRHLAPEYWGPASALRFEDLASGEILQGFPADLVPLAQGVH